MNILAVCQATQLSIKSMERAAIDGYIININSVLSYYLHNLPKNIPHGMYTSTKFALTAISEALRKELINKESRIKVSVRNCAVEFYKSEKCLFFIEHQPWTSRYRIT